MKIPVTVIDTEFKTIYWGRDYITHYVRTSWMDINGFLVKE